MTTTIFMDESGYTRENLMNIDQPFFTLATLHCSEQECQDYVAKFFSKVKMPELKYSKLMQNGHHQVILTFLTELAETPELVKIFVCQKRYELAKRIVQILVVPAAKKESIDLRIKGQDLAFTHDLYNYVPTLTGKDFFDDLLRRFQNMMIRLDRESYDQFFDPLFDRRYPKLDDTKNQRMLDFYLDRIKSAHTTLGYSFIGQRDTVVQSLGIPHSRPLDVAFPGAMLLMQQWRKEITDSIDLIHDKSSRMAEVMHFWNTIFHHHPPPAIRQLVANDRGSALGIARTSGQDSKVWRGIQLTDTLAGATRSWANWLLAGRKSEDWYESRLDTIMTKLQPIPNWPVPPLTADYFEKNGLTEEEARLQDELADKLTIFHRIRAIGYSYQIFPEETE